MTAPEATSTRPYLIRALFEWCSDNGFTPHIAVRADRGVQVPREFVRDGEIVLNISYDATSGLQMGNDFITFTARFGGQSRDIMVPVDKVMAIYARETGQGMAFPPEAGDEQAEDGGSEDGQSTQPADDAPVSTAESQAQAGAERVMQLVTAQSETTDDEPPRTPPPAGSRPSLKLVK